VASAAPLADSSLRTDSSRLSVASTIWFYVDLSEGFVQQHSQLSPRQLPIPSELATAAMTSAAAPAHH
jgi:hypothetical protein